MTIKLEYSSSLNGASYLLFELKQVVKLKKMKLTTKEIRNKVVIDNVFQFENIGRISRILPSIMKRVNVIDGILATIMLEESIEMSKVINLYAIMKTDLLFFEFMNEVISEKLHQDDFLIEKKDINLFFTSKAEQSDRVAGWSNSNIEKLKSTYMLILFESGMLINRSGKELSRIIIDEQIKNHLIDIGDVKYVHAMGE